MRLVIAIVVMAYCAQAIAIGSLNSGTSEVSIKVGGGTRIVGLCKSTGDLLSPSNYEKGVEAQITVAETAAKAASEDQVKTRELIEKTGDYLAKSFNATMKQFGSAQERVRLEEAFGPNRHIESDCESPDVAASALAGESRGKQLVVVGDKLVQNHRRSASSFSEGFMSLERQQGQMRMHLGENGGRANDAALPVNLLLPREGSIPDTTQSMEAATGFVMALTDPFPDPVLPDQKRNIPRLMNADQRKYTVVNQLKADRLSVSQRVLLEVLANNTATVSTGEWADNLWNEMGGVGAFPGKSGEKISKMQMYDLLTNGRFANGAYQRLVKDGANIEGLLVRLIMSESLETRMYYEMLKDQQRILTMTALQAATQIQNGYSDQVETLIPAIKAKSMVNE